MERPGTASSNMVPGRDGKTYLPFYTKHSLFSNHYFSEFEYEGTSFASSEQLYFYFKATYFKDEETAQKISYSGDPNKAKGLSRKIRNQDGEEWKKVSVDYMYRAVKIKFTSDPSLRKALLDTRDAVLVEASPRDKFWGVGLATTSKDIAGPSKWRGANTLGQVLMRLRDELKDTEK